MIKKIEKSEMQRQALKTTPARLDISSTGSRYKTKDYLDFLAAQSAAADAVFTEVSKDTINQLGMLEIKTKCKSKHDMITRPDWGRIIEEDQQQMLLENCEQFPDVQIYFGDGLSSPSIAANAKDIFEILKKGLNDLGKTVGTPFFVRYCRVNTARTIGPLLGAKVVCVLIGERPGLITDESMSAYIARKPSHEMQESDYTVISNISRHGVLPVEAAAHMVDLLVDML